MIFHFLKVEKPETFSENYGKHKIELGYHYEADVEPIVFHFDALPIKNGCLLKCHFDYSVTLPCARCLEDVKLSGTTKFAVELKQESALISKIDEKREEFEDFEEIFVEEDIFETLDLVDGQLIYLLPEKTLCKEDCKGLCPNCGKNKNEGDCDCRIDIDPRWSPLSKILK